MDIIKVRNADYSRYEELLIERDRLRKACYILRAKYVHEFGDLIMDLFKAQIACIRKKKEITCYQAAVNRGEMIDRDAIEALIRREMSVYAKQLEDLAREKKASDEMDTISTAKLTRIKRIYRRLAKKLHPDINPMTEQVEELSELWEAIQAAYNSNELKDLEELEVLVGNALEKLHMGNMEIEIPDLDAKIRRLEEDIKMIRTTEPYTYDNLLNDEAAVAAKKEELKAQKQHYLDYARELDEVIERILGSGAGFKWTIN